jgi:hypothetical protein
MLLDLKSRLESALPGAISNPQSAIRPSWRSPQFAIRSSWRSPQSAIRISLLLILLSFWPFPAMSHHPLPTCEQNPPVLWRQPIKNGWTRDYPNSPQDVFPDCYTISPHCDGDDPDKDIAIKFPLNATSPDNLRWTSTSPRVYLVFWAAYDLSLWQFRDNHNETWLCIGTRGLWAAGGIEKVMQTVFVHEEG